MKKLPIKIQTDNGELNRYQDILLKYFGNLDNANILDNRLIESVLLTSSKVNVINHKLNRNIRGYIIVSKSSNANIWDDQLSNTKKNRELHLQTSANTTVNILVF